MGSQSRVLPNVRTGKRGPATRTLFRGLLLSAALMPALTTCAVRAGEDAWEALSLDKGIKRMTRPPVVAGGRKWVGAGEEGVLRDKRMQFS